MLPESPCSAEELGSIIGISSRAVRAHAAAGKIRKTKRGRYKLPDAIFDYCTHMRQLVVGGGGEQAAAHGASERARLAKEQADAVALRNAVARGALLDAGEVERTWSADYAAVRAGVLAASSRIGSRLPHLSLSDIAEIDEELRALLAGLGGAQ
jgi:terminase small subunit / prophage DNA-packing protein